MSVNPGYGGQKFIPRSLDKVRELNRVRQAQGLSFQIEIDGGVGPGNVADVVRAGRRLGGSGLVCVRGRQTG